MQLSQEIAKAALEIGAFQINIDKPFEWASGYRMPVYSDFRRFLFFPKYRKLITEGFQQLIKERKIPYDIIAGNATAGIPYGTSLADALNVPFIYVRSEAKKHGLKNQIEGIDSEKDIEGKIIPLIEDVISTGGSSAKGIQAIRNANGEVNHCLAIFTYGFEKSLDMFLGHEYYDKEQTKKLSKGCILYYILNYQILLEKAKEIGKINKKQVKELLNWREDQFNWGENNGFPRVFQ